MPKDRGDVQNVYLYNGWDGDGDFSDLIMFMIDIKEKIRKHVPDKYMQYVQFRTDEKGFSLWYTKPRSDD